MKFTGWEERSRYSRNAFFSRPNPAKGRPAPRFTAHSLFFSAVLDFFCDSCQGQKVIIVVFHFVSQNRLPAGSAHIILSLVFQRVLQGIWFVPVSCDTGWEGKMPGFDCVVPMIDSNVPVFLILSLALLKIYFSGGKLEKASCCKDFVLSQPVNPGGECVREGENGKSAPAALPGRF